MTHRSIERTVIATDEKPQHVKQIMEYKILKLIGVEKYPKQEIEHTYWKIFGIKTPIIKSTTISAYSDIKINVLFDKVPATGDIFLQPIKGSTKDGNMFKVEEIFGRIATISPIYTKEIVLISDTMLLLIKPALRNGIEN